MTIIVLVSIAVIAGVLHWWSTRPDTSPAHEPPPLFYSLDSSPPPIHVNGNGTAHSPMNGNGTRTHVNGNGTQAHVNGNGTQRPAESHVVRPIAVESPRVNHRRPVRPLDAEHIHAEHANSDHDNAETIRFVRPSDPDAAVQLLPGRLEVLEGATPHREIRFMRIPGEPAHVILGREVRLTPHYVGLGSPTVSRRHARFDFTDNQWVVKNLSRTNPLVLNDDELFDTDVARPLADGDRLELGDVVLRFHAH